MSDVVWTTRAQVDLAEVAEYHAARSPGYAEVLVRRLLGAVGRLEAFPRSGRAVPEVADESVREVVYRDYRIIYL
ncbi:type II toxin-antitoxin system RelE/ParE family toxin [Rubrivirga sp.]|uniref:type II toxin-antitoxin system RelE/ParE family toxin n=1 Tax=Rubrivirga sp. TaxID=1885344 RepID=UPI003B52F2E7